METLLENDGRGGALEIPAQQHMAWGGSGLRLHLEVNGLSETTYNPAYNPTSKWVTCTTPLRGIVGRVRSGFTQFLEPASREASGFGV